MGPGAFVGRKAALATLADAWARVVEGASVVVWVDGEQGVGKTSLVRRFTDALRADQVTWVTADPDETWRDLEVWTTLLARLGHADAHDAAALEADPNDDHGRRLLDALTAGSEPRVVVVDDLGYVDPPSLLALRFALRRLESDGVLAVLTVGERPWHALGDTWRRFLDDPHLALHVHLSGLTTEELVALTRTLGVSPIDSATVERLRAHTGGLPLHAVALLQELGATGLAAPAAVLPSPRSFAEVTLARVATLDDAAQALLRAGAVLGATFRAAEAARIGDIDDPGPALDDAVRARLLHSVEAGVAAFEHPLVRGAIHGALTSVERRALHLAAASATSGVTSLLHRAEAAVQGDDDLAAEIELAAAAESAVTDPARVADLLLVAARVAGSISTSERLTLQAVETLVAGSHVTRATALRDRVAACASGPQRDLVLALLDARSGRFEEAHARFLTAADGGYAVQDGPSGPGDIRARALAGAAFIDWVWGDATSALERATEALEGDVGWGASLTCCARVMSLVHLGHFDELREHPLGEVIPESLGTVDRLAISGIVRLYLDDLAAAASDLAEAIESGRTATASQLFAMGLAVLAEVELRRGRWDAATIDADLAIAFASEGSGLHALIQAHTVAVELSAARGRFVDAQSHLEEAAALVSLAPAWGARTRVAIARAALAHARSDHVEVIAAGQELTSGDLHDVLGRFPTWRWRATVAEGLLAEDRLDAAQSAIDAVADIVETHRPHAVSTGAVASLTRLRGRLAQARGDDEGALEWFAQPDIDTDGAAPLPVALLSMDHAFTLRRLGRAAEAIPLLKSAQAMLVDLGAVAYEDACHEALVACGVDAEPTPPDPLSVLTPRQEAVARLVVKGLTNKEVAAELFVGAKTVEYHLTQIFMKLDVHSRRDLADLAGTRRAG